MNEKPPNSASLFLNEDADKPRVLDKADLRRRLCRAMERRASSMKQRIGSIGRKSLKRFFRRNLFVLFTVAAVALGQWRLKHVALFSLLVTWFFCFLLYLFVCMCGDFFLPRCNLGLCSTPTQPFPEGNKILLLSWGAPDENAEDAGAASYCFQSGHRLASDES
ncbi:hypothetical protein XENOCAPTIV_004650 [Xenoophorus captivus]|uniref:Uncharacterized protein n=1 Tax=Xenoophorus captivus TaxID=1517983 RepID=A0ABV0RNQ4_9TELE